VVFMRIISSYLGAQRNWETSEWEITFGRPGEKSPSLLDLSPDNKVSRLHGRIWHENGFCWIEDLNSGRGTLLNNVEIKGQGKKRIQAGDVIVAGNTTLLIESPDPPVTTQTNFLETGTSLLPDERRAQADGSIVHELDATAFNPLGTAVGMGLILPAQGYPGKGALNSSGKNGPNASLLEASREQTPQAIEQGARDMLKSNRGDSSHANQTGLVSFAPNASPRAPDIAERRLNLICELPMHLAAKTQLALLLPAIVDRLVEMIPGAQCWALLLREGKTNTLLLKAYRSAQQPSLSETLARRAISKGNAFIWKRDVEKDVRGSLLEDSCVIGMYAPMLWQEEAVGVICATAWNAETTFSDEDLRLIVVVAQYAAMAVAGHQLQEKLREESVVRANLLRQFSPQVADRLLGHRGRLRLGGQRSEVTILNADIRGFTQLAQNMDPDDIVELLNDYFSVMVPLIFAHEGTVDKFMGDAILAIFGSPVSDPEHHEHAILAAIEMQTAIAKLNETRRLRGSPCPEIGIGMHCGEVVHGLVGTQNRMEFTVIGDVVNRTSRYCAGAAGGDIVISPDMYERLWRMAETEQTTIHTKHEGDFVAYRVKRLKTGAELDTRGRGD
jgi:class 3 adenylate cyclase